ncbi:prp3 U4/U5/U6 small nuclear ribonucleoprotein prp3 [Candida maltosa Xu316]|uniref:Uncharacterized protein n=1 Tax=Candida maltosa (strain Xu316) TaxID=1245528 RepID=M3HTF7_CANMX|nr:hypothetical protein G210_5969 [Candida maltosa Xu316]
MKRRIDTNTNDGAKKSKVSISQEKLDIAKERVRQLQQQKQSKSGLDVEIHPLLRNIGTTPTLPKKHNPVKRSSGNQRKWFDPMALNPYLDQSNIGSKKHVRPLQFNQQGKFIAQGDKLREKLKIEEEEKRKYEEIKREGLLADESLGEHLYKPEPQPLIEWWDRPYLRDNNYSRINDESRIVLDNDDQPVTSYIQHPVLTRPIWENKERETKPMYLTKKEQKRMRRNDRQIRHQEKQDRIKLGLDPPPPPKVKLSNLMNVLTNEAIKDPTAVENRVKREMQQRVNKHLAENEARKLTKDQKHEKLWSKQDKDLEKGIFSTIYKVDDLSNPKHLFKIDISAKEDNLFGICLKNPKFNLIIVEGGEKSIKQYKKIMTNRIKWTEVPTNNKCEIVWEGALTELHFQKWSIMHSRTDEEAINVLQKFNLENYWRLSNSK